MANKIKIDNAILKRQARKNAIRKKTKKVLCRILIVCEGEKTEPSYFENFKKINNESFVYEVECQGGGINTMTVVKKAIELRDKAPIPYDSVWAVFDKDDFPPKSFNGAIIKAKANNINVAWSNEAFELWYLYHFNNRITAMSRSNYQKAISEAVNRSGKWKSKNAYRYAKNDSHNYSIMTTYGNQDNAIKWAKEQHLQYTDERYANHNPCTTVYQLVIQLLNKDSELIEQVMKKIESTSE